MHIYSCTNTCTNTQIVYHHHHTHVYNSQCNVLSLSLSLSLSVLYIAADTHHTTSSKGSSSFLRVCQQCVYKSCVLEGEETWSREGEAHVSINDKS